MSKQSLALLTLCTALCTACGNDSAFEPQYPVIPAEATVTANQSGGWSSWTVSVTAGGTVTWVVPDGVPISEIVLNPFDPNEETLKVINGSVSRTFPIHGRFYFCALMFCPSDLLSGKGPFSVQVY